MDADFRKNGFVGFVSGNYGAGMWFTLIMIRRCRILKMLLAVASVGVGMQMTGAYGYKFPPVESNVPYGTHPHETIDVFVPTTGKPPYPVVICYGGLWVSGKDPRGTDPYPPLGIAAVAVQSRGLSDAMAAKINPPIAWVMQDAVRVVQFVRLNAARWKLDPNRIALEGASQAGLPALYVACSADKANPNATDPVERTSTKVLGVALLRVQPSIDPKRMQEWVPGVEWGAPSLGMSFADSLKNYDKVLPYLKEYSPDWLVNKETPPLYFYNNEGLIPAAGVDPMGGKVHSPAWGLGFQRLALERSDANVYVQYPGHASPFPSFTNFLQKMLIPGSK